jgi:uncharacterized protein (TIGR00290 family)
MEKLWMSWSSGKDSAFALAELLKSKDFEVTGLFTSLNETYGRVAMHSTRLELLNQQANELGLPLELVPLPANCTNEIYEHQMQILIKKAKANGVTAMGFGDLFLQDVRDYRVRQLEGSGIRAVFPLWGRPTKALAAEMTVAEFGAILTCIDPKKLPHSFAGKLFNGETLSEFPDGVDPCGENGEFHSFVYKSPNFKNEIPISIGERLEREGFVFADVILTV